MYKNFASAQVATAPSPSTSGTSIVLGTGQAASLPTAPFKIGVTPANQLPTQANSEIMLVTAVSGDTLTVTRQQESSNARAVAVGDNVTALLTAGHLLDGAIGAPTLPAIVSNTTEQVIARWLVPANVLRSGWGAQIALGLQWVSAATGTFRIRAGALGTTADGEVAAFTAITTAQAANAYATLNANVYMPSGTTMDGTGFIIAQAAVLGVPTAAAAVATVAPTAPVYITATLTQGGTTGVQVVRSASLVVRS